MSLFPVHTVDTDFALCHKLIYSYPKQGKTTMAAQMVSQGRQPLFLMTEDGLGSLRVPFVRTRSWNGFTRLVMDLETKRDQVRAEYSTIVIDVVGDLDQWCQAEIAQERRVEHIADMEGGKGWSILRQQLTHQFSILMSIAPVTFIAHSQEKEIKINGEKIKGNAPSLGKACFEFINGKVDVIMWINPATSKNRDPKVIMRPTAMAIAGARQKAIAKEYDFSPANPSAAYAQICADYKAAQLQLQADPVATTVDAPAPAQPKE